MSPGSGRAPPKAPDAVRSVLVGGPPNLGTLARPNNPRGTIARLARMFAGFGGRLFVVAACIVMATLLGLLGPYLMGIGIDRFIARRQASGLESIGLLMLATFLASSAFQLASSWLMAGVSQRALKVLRGDLFRHVQTLPLDFFEQRSSGELMSRLTNDIDAINQAVAQNVTSLFASTLSMIGILVAMFALDRRLALASLVVVPIMFGFTRFVAVYTRKGFKDLQKHLGTLNGEMEEAIAGQKVVRLFRRTASVQGRFIAQSDDVYRVAVVANTFALLLMPLTSVLGNLFVIVLASLGGWLALQGLVSVGIIATFISYGQNFVQPLRQLSNLYNTLQAALAGAERVFEIIDTPAEVDAGRVARTSTVVGGDVTFERVTFGYRPGKPVIRDMSFAARRGQVVALVGPTGAGKTTIINLLTRFYEIDAGVIRIDGRDITQLAKADLRSMLGLVLQDSFLFGTSVMENIRYGRLGATDEEVVRAAELADADHFIRQLPGGYGAVLSERGGNLSQGQRQLLAIARTLLADPAILILDEATSSIDTRTEARIQTSLLRLMNGRTSFVIAHRLSTIRDAHQILVIDAGNVVERGTHRELLLARGAYHQLYTSQFKGQTL